MKTLAWDPDQYRCYGGAGMRNHAKGCKNDRSLRWDPKEGRLYTLECARYLDPATQWRLIRCVPKNDRSRIDPDKYEREHGRA